MFKEKSPSPGETDTLIGTGTEFEGHLISQACVRIDGAFSGEIDIKGDLVVGEKGTAKANITARDVTIAGKVYGDVHTRGKLTITSSGQLHGNAHAAALIVQEGGVLNGTSQMERAETLKGVSAGGEGVGGATSGKREKQAG